MATTQKPSRQIIVSAKTTQEITLDKKALQEQLQHSVETILPSVGIEKQEIEPGHVIYDFDYQQLAGLMEIIYDHGVVEFQNGKNRDYGAVQDYYVRGEGKDTTFVLKVNLAKMLALQKQPITIDGIDATTPIPKTPEEISKAFAQVFILNAEGLRIDGQGLLALIQSCVGRTTQDGGYEEKSAFKHQVATMLAMGLSYMGGDTVRNGDEITLRIPLDVMFSKLEKVNATSFSEAVHVQRKDGHATIRVDYNHLVDMACKKAEKISSKLGSEKVSFAKIDENAVQIAWTTNGLEKPINNFIDKLSRQIAENSKKALPAALQNMGTLDDKPARGLAD